MSNFHTLSLNHDSFDQNENSMALESGCGGGKDEGKVRTAPGWAFEQDFAQRADFG
jgi:hypothetical protein